MRPAGSRCPEVRGSRYQEEPSLTHGDPSYDAWGAQEQPRVAFVTCGSLSVFILWTACALRRRHVMGDMVDGDWGEGNPDQSK